METKYDREFIKHIYNRAKGPDYRSWLDGDEPIHILQKYDYTDLDLYMFFRQQINFAYGLRYLDVIYRIKWDHLLRT